GLGRSGGGAPILWIGAVSEDEAGSLPGNEQHLARLPARFGEEGAPALDTGGQVASLRVEQLRAGIAEKGTGRLRDIAKLEAGLDVTRRSLTSHVCEPQLLRRAAL